MMVVDGEWIYTNHTSIKNWVTTYYAGVLMVFGKHQGVLKASFFWGTLVPSIFPSRFPTS